MLPAIAFAVLSGLPALNPLPDGRSIDRLSYTFWTHGAFGGRGTLAVGADGKAGYAHETDPFTNHGGTFTRKEWAVPPNAAAALFRELVAAGVFELKDATPQAPHTFHITSGKWQLALAAEVVPEKIAAALRPLLAEAHPELWGAKAPVPPGPNWRPSLSKLRYEFASKVTGDTTALEIARDGRITYQWKSNPNTDGHATISAEWQFSASETAALLDTLTAAGILGLEDSGGGWFPSHAITARAGRWQRSYHPKELPDDVLKHLRPLLTKVDPECWKPTRQAPVSADVGGAVLAGTLGVKPLPDAHSPIDSLSYAFGGGGAFGANGSLRIAKDGTVNYQHSTAPFTGSGGIRTHKDWKLTCAEQTELFAKMVADGLLDGGKAGTFLDTIRVTSGRWGMSLSPDQIPERALRHLRPLLKDAHPALWSEESSEPRKPLPPKTPVAKPAPKVPLVAKPAPQPGVLWQLNYHFCPASNGDRVLLYIGRNGEVSYQRYNSTATGLTKTYVQTGWTVPVKETEAILDALAVHGVCDLEIVNRERFPVHRVEVGCGAWWSTFHTKPLPEKFMERLRPLLRKADPDFWK